jgi:hypothetical protein
MLVLSAPCHGFGDAVFAMKFTRYLRAWYPSAHVTIATAQPDLFASLGEPRGSLAVLGAGKGQCRRFRRMRAPPRLPQQDLIFVAPLTVDFEIDLGDVRALLPYASAQNTYFLSEYNDTLRKGFDFDTGVGGARVGLLLTKAAGSRPPRSLLPHAYALAYVADTDDAERCVRGFVELVAAKYGPKNGKLDVVVTPWLGRKPRTLRKLAASLAPAATRRFARVDAVDARGRRVTASRRAGAKNRNTTVLTLRGDVLPVKHADMQGIIRFSLPDILVTGDQSLTDAVSCCREKIIWYQVAPWKESFARELAHELPNRYLLSKRTSCGTLRAMHMNADTRRIARNWDFRRLARPAVDAAVRAAAERKRDPRLAELEDLVATARTLRQARRRLARELEALPA